MISPDEYIEQRLSDQIGWYDRKSSTNERWFKRLRCRRTLPQAALVGPRSLAERELLSRSYLCTCW
jgi:hypothetical protein